MITLLTATPSSVHAVPGDLEPDYFYRLEDRLWIYNMYISCLNKMKGNSYLSDVIFLLYIFNLQFKSSQLEK